MSSLAVVPSELRSLHCQDDASRGATFLCRIAGAEPEVQAEVALYQTTRSPKETLVEYTSRISNKLREMQSGF